MSKCKNKTVKKIGIVVIVSILLIIIFLPVFNPIKMIGQFVPYEYTIHGTYIEITKYIGIESEVDIPSYLWFRPVRKISSQTGRAGFRDLENVTYIKIPDTVTTLSGAPFERCKNLEEIEMGYNIKKIPTGCFAYCKSLKKIALSEAVESIALDAFVGCESLEKVICYNPNIKIDKESFENRYASCNFDILTLVSAKDSAVERYAKEHGIKWEELKE